MKHILLMAWLGMFGLTGAALAQQGLAGPFETDLKLNELASLPVGLTVVHAPEIVMEPAVGPTGSKWQHSTTVAATDGPVEIVEFGFFRFEGERWTLATVNQAPYTAENFAKWYGCPKGELQPGASYTDPSNFSLGGCSAEPVARWYFIGVDMEGRRVKGEADVKLVCDMDDC